jgi:hypothetical protein
LLRSKHALDESFRKSEKFKKNEGKALSAQEWEQVAEAEVVLRTLKVFCLESQTDNMAGRAAVAVMFVFQLKLGFAGWTERHGLEDMLGHTTAEQRPEERANFLVVSLKNTHGYALSKSLTARAWTRDRESDIRHTYDP